MDEFKDEPVHGGGAGSYEAWWAQHGELSFFVRDAHSLYVETLGELGIVGLVLLLGFFVTAAAVGASRLLSGDDEQRAAVAALLAVAAGYLLEAGIDWMWELTAVSVVAMVAFGLLTGPSTVPPTPFAAERTRRPLVGVLAVVVALALIVAEGIPVLATMSIRHSQDAAADERQREGARRRPRGEVDPAMGSISVPSDRARAGAGRTAARSPCGDRGGDRTRPGRLAALAGEGEAGDEERPHRAGPREPCPGPGAEPALAASFLGIVPKHPSMWRYPPQHRSIARTRD